VAAGNVACSARQRLLWARSSSGQLAPEHSASWPAVRGRAVCAQWGVRGVRARALFCVPALKAGRYRVRGGGDFHMRQVHVGRMSGAQEPKRMRRIAWCAALRCWTDGPRAGPTAGSLHAWAGPQRGFLIPLSVHIPMCCFCTPLQIEARLMSCRGVVSRWQVDLAGRAQSECIQHENVTAEGTLPHYKESLGRAATIRCRTSSHQLSACGPSALPCAAPATSALAPRSGPAHTSSAAKTKVSSAAVCGRCSKNAGPAYHTSAQHIHTALRTLINALRMTVTCFRLMRSAHMKDANRDERGEKIP